LQIAGHFLGMWPTSGDGGNRAGEIDAFRPFLRRQALHPSLKALILRSEHTETIMIGYKSIIAVLLSLAINNGYSQTIGVSQQVNLLKSGVENWNKWRKEHIAIIPHLDSADLGGANLGGANLPKANLKNANLRGTNLEGANLAGANLLRAYLRGADLLEAHLAGANLQFADLRGVDFRGTNLEGANLEGANLLRASLRGADLLEAHFEGTNLQFADLWKADLGGTSFLRADLLGAKFEEADLSKVKSFYKAKLDTNILSEIKTNWPEKLATIWDDAKKDWDIDSALLEQVKKPDWQGW